MPGSPPPEPGAPVRDLEDTPAAMGLLSYLTVHSLDDDYQHVAARRTPTKRGRGRLLGALGAAVFAILVVTAATQTSKNAVTDEHERRQLIAQINARKAQLDADQKQLSSLQTQTAALRARLLTNDRLSAGTRARLSLLASRSGTVAVHGPGVSVVVDDAPHAEGDRNRVLDSDLQALVNGLWEAGAEAVSVNGHRLTNLSAIREAGSAITVNYRSLSRPYTVLAIGNNKVLPARFADSSSGQAWLDLQQQVGLQFTMRIRSSLSLPAAPLPVLRSVDQKGGPAS